MENLKLSVVEMHTGGEPLRILVSGYPEIQGKTVMEKLSYVKHKLDYIRKFVMLEPRGHCDMFGAILVKPDIPEANAGVLFTHNEGYATMCGHGVIALGRYCVDNKIVEYNEPETKVKFQCPCGLVQAWVKCCNGISGSVRFHSVSAFVVALGLELTVPGYGDLKLDVSYGGAFYAFLPLQSVGLNAPSPVEHAKAAAVAIKKAFPPKDVLTHPEDERLAFLFGVVFTDTNQPADGTEHFNLTVFADAEVDRSPCGSATTARMALFHAQGLVAVNQKKTFENPLTKSKFTAKVVKETGVGKFDAVVVEVEGNAYYTGTATFTQEKEDELRGGFMIK